MAIVMQTRMRRAFAMHLGPYLGLWVPNRARSLRRFQVPRLKGGGRRRGYGSSVCAARTRIHRAPLPLLPCWYGLSLWASLG